MSSGKWRPFCLGLKVLKLFSPGPRWQRPWGLLQYRIPSESIGDSSHDHNIHHICPNVWKVRISLYFKPITWIKKEILTVHADYYRFGHLLDLSTIHISIITLSWTFVLLITLIHISWFRNRKLVDRTCINLSPPSAAYVCQWIGSALVQIMACRLFGAKPLSKPMLGYCQLDL